MKKYHFIIIFRRIIKILYAEIISFSNTADVTWYQSRRKGLVKCISREGRNSSSSFKSIDKNKVSNKIIYILVTNTYLILIVYNLLSIKVQYIYLPVLFFAI